MSSLVPMPQTLVALRAARLARMATSHRTHRQSSRSRCQEAANKRRPSSVHQVAASRPNHAWWCPPVSAGGAVRDLLDRAACSGRPDAGTQQARTAGMKQVHARTYLVLRPVPRCVTCPPDPGSDGRTQQGSVQRAAVHTTTRHQIGHGPPCTAPATAKE